MGLSAQVQPGPRGARESMVGGNRYDFCRWRLYANPTNDKL
jgi:hypothetical protein